MQKNKTPDVQLKLIASPVALSIRLCQRFALKRGRLPGCCLPTSQKV